jgi:hypothetical protein
MNQQELESQIEVFRELNQGLIDVTQRIITDWSVTRDLGPAIEEAQAILKLAREARLQWPTNGETSALSAGGADATSGSGPTNATSTNSHAAITAMT